MLQTKTIILYDVIDTEGNFLQSCVALSTFLPDELVRYLFQFLTLLSTLQGLTVDFNEACSEGQWHNWLQKEAITYEVIHSKCSHGFGGPNTFFWSHQCRHFPFVNCLWHVFSRMHVTLHLALSVRPLFSWSVCWSVTLLLFLSILFL